MVRLLAREVLATPILVSLRYCTAVRLGTAARGLVVRPTFKKIVTLAGRASRPSGRVVHGGGWGLRLDNQGVPSSSDRARSARARL